MSEFQPVNFYQQLPSKYIKKKSTYKGYDKIKIEVPFRACVIGASGSMKTNTVLNLISTLNYWTQFYVFAKQVNEPLYQYLIDTLEAMGKKIGKQLVFYSDNCNDIPDLDEVDTKENKTLFIFDDLLLEDKTSQRKMSEIFIRGRRKDCSAIYVSQSYFQVPLLIRQNSDYVIFKKVNSVKDFGRIAKEYLGDEITPAELYKLLAKIRAQGQHNFLLIDLNTNDTSLRYRMNFEGLNIKGDEGLRGGFEEKEK